MPDEFYVFKPTLRQGYRPLIWKRLGTKEQRMVYDEAGSKLVKNVQVSPLKIAPASRERR
jgi:pyruvate,water dikinase